MVRARWRKRIGPPSILLGLALLLTAAITTSAAMAASRRPVFGSVAQCSVAPAKAARAALRNDSEARSVARAEQRLSRTGEFIGRTLRVDRATDGTIEIQLPVESFVGRRQGNAVVYTRAGGSRGSEVHLVNLATGCDTLVAQPAGIVRSAILSPDASAVFVHSVTSGSRLDAGVMRHDLASGAANSFVPALAPSRLTGRIFGTQLAWSVDGRSLVVQSCGFARCLSRIADLDTGRIATVDGPGQGALIGATASTLVTYSTCLGRPCSVIAWDVATGIAKVVAIETFDASLVTGSDGTGKLILETATGLLEVAL